MCIASLCARPRLARMGRNYCDKRHMNNRRFPTAAVCHAEPRDTPVGNRAGEPRGQLGSQQLSADRVLCAVPVTCANPWSLADRSAAQSFQSEHVLLEAWPQGGARSRPRRQCSRDSQSFSGAPRSFHAWSCAEFMWARGAFNSVERLSLVREQVRFWNCFSVFI